jgi:hypothetical protein
LLPPIVNDSEVAIAGLLWFDPGTTVDPWYHRSLPRPDWSYTTVMTQEVLAQNVSWAAASAVPPSARRPTFLLVLSDERLTW